MEDTQIIQLFFARSEEAIMALAEKYGTACQKLSFNILQDNRDAEECVNDSYLTVWNRVPPAIPSPLFAYLCKIVRNLSIDRYRKRHAAKRTDTLTVAWEELEPFLPAASTPEQEMDSRQITIILNQFLGTLSRQDRLMFLRRYWFMDSYQEIAQIAGLNENTLSVRLTRIRKKLKTYLQENEVYL